MSKKEREADESLVLWEEKRWRGGRVRISEKSMYMFIHQVEVDGMEESRRSIQPATPFSSILGNDPS